MLPTCLLFHLLLILRLGCAWMKGIHFSILPCIDIFLASSITWLTQDLTLHSLCNIEKIYARPYTTISYCHFCVLRYLSKDPRLGLILKASSFFNVLVFATQIGVYVQIHKNQLVGSIFILGVLRFLSNQISKLRSPKALQRRNIIQCNV